jgi:hypothetical protein
MRFCNYVFVTINKLYTQKSAEADFIDVILKIGRIMSIIKMPIRKSSTEDHK